VQAQKDRNIKAAGTLAMGLAAGVVMSALAMDLTDAAVAGALLAAGARVPACVQAPACAHNQVTSL
jgi:hypothetical protein